MTTVGLEDRKIERCVSHMSKVNLPAQFQNAAPVYQYVSN